jgi:hypothetical protein
MGYRKFTDREGNTWQIREDSRDRWTFEPIQGNSNPSVEARPPGYENDPYEMSTKEMQRLLDASQLGRPKPRRSPFAD